MTQLVSFSSVISREIFRSGTLSETVKIDLKAYFVGVKLRYESGEEFPYGIDELIPTVYPRKDHAVRALEEQFNQGIDFIGSPKMGSDNNPRPSITYRLSPLAFEFMVARKSKDVFSLYHTVFHARTASNDSTRSPLDSAIYYSQKGYELAKLFGFDGNMAVLSADNFGRNASGISVLNFMGAAKLPANPQGMTYIPTKLGELVEPTVSARSMNKMLEAAGLQVFEKPAWIPTDKAAGLYEWVDTGKHHSTGSPVKQLMWFGSVLDHLPVTAATTAP